MRSPKAPRFEERRTADFAAELKERARAWIPSWGLADGEGDFGRALLDIAARFSSEVAERLDGAGEKMRRGFLDWLGVRGEAARPARMPVVFKLADAAREAVLASAPVRLQADADGTPVVFETEGDVRVVPGQLEVVVGVDADADAFFLPPPGLNDLKPLEPLPAQWQLKSFAAAGAKKLQLDPEAGLAVDLTLEGEGQQYRIVKVDKDIVTIEPGLTGELPSATTLGKVTSFAPFDGAARNRQEHALYLGHPDLLNIEAAATFEIVGAQGLVAGIAWQYWGKVDPLDEVDWQPLTLAEKQTPGAVALTKPKGAVELLSIAGNSSRWLRAFTTNVPPGPPLTQIDTLEIRVNCVGNPKLCTDEAGAQETAPAAEAMANTTPLVLEGVFFPLGKEPRQFDAFYLGSEEAFSKKGARAQLCFEMADPSFATLARMRGGLWSHLMAGVAKDRALHLLLFDPATGTLAKLLGRDPLQPPLPGFQGNAQTTNPVALDRMPGWRLPMWTEGFDFLVGASAGADVWVWHEKFMSQITSGWVSFGQLPATAPPATKAVQGLVYLADPATPQMAALREGKLFVREWPNGPQWDAIDTEDPLFPGVPVELSSIVPILTEIGSSELVTSALEGMVGVGVDKQLYQVDLTGACTPLSATDFNPDVRPVAVLRASGDLVIAAVETSLSDLVTVHSALGEFSTPLAVGEEVKGLDVVITTGGQLHFLASVRDAGAGVLVSWASPTPAAPAMELFRVSVPASVGEVGGAPTQVAQHVVIPGQRADALVAEFDLARRVRAGAVVNAGIVLSASAPALVPNDVVTRMMAGAPESRTITDYGIAREGEVFYPIDAAFSAAATGPLLTYRASAPLTGIVTLPDEVELEIGDREATIDSWLLVDGTPPTFHRITNLVRIDPWVATVTPNLPGPAGSVNYARPLPTGGRTTPFMRLDPLTNGNWDAALLQRVPLVFPGATPERQAAKAFSVDSGNHPIVVALAAEFSVAPVQPPGTFVVDAAAGEWSRLLGDTSSNPELSWEYWNGKGWWKLDVTLDETLHLKASGAIRFKVPADLVSSDWAGKTNHWVRARLIGGDYGREKVTVTTKPTGTPGVTQQTVERSSEGIRAPSVVKLDISYRVCDGVMPTFVLAQDSGSIRDQSDANRTGGAIVEALVPLAATLGRLARGGVAPVEPDDCPPECDCRSGITTGAAVPVPVPTPGGVAASATGRALFVGLAASLSEAPVNVLLLVEQERSHGGFAPLRIDALVADRFVPIVANDPTRALGESGLLSMAFAVPPTPRELFGRTLTWLRLTPSGGAAATEWKPTLRGAYLNASWASAAETLTRELLGSSDGSPHLTFTLARPPVLRDSLELRVKEPLGEEEREALLAENPQRVLRDLADLPGDWVLWDRVIDPGDEPPGARVYALDEANGVIGFGDGEHGMIPPIGRDSIVAFSYRRTEPGAAGSDSVPANSITARAPLGLVSPVESVEAVFAADQAAGGGPPEKAERVLRFGSARLRHRNRAVTAQDLEDLALQSSPDIAQARCFVRRGSVRLVIVMRGRNPQPTAAQVRELRRLLLDAAPAGLSAPNTLRIAGPAIRRLRIDLGLRVATLDHAGALGREATKRLKALFDTATGGAEQLGWALGENPGEGDIALALIDAPYLEGIAGVTLRENMSDGTERAWPQALKPTELAVLAEDPLRIQFATVEVAA